jgi:hypothetical protein
MVIGGVHVCGKCGGVVLVSPRVARSVRAGSLLREPWIL